MKFTEQIKNPKWQKKRLEILQRDNFKCRACKDTHKTLHVHHLAYDNSIKYWEYSNIELITLCETCHKEWHRIFDNDSHDIASLIINLRDEIENESIIEFLDKNCKL